MRPHPLLIVALVGALVGSIFAGFSTYDYAQHLDRQVHDIHCSFVPGISEGGAESSGCDVTMKSSYSSVFGKSMWGGIPISLPAMAVFAFLLFFGADLLFARRQDDVRATGFYAAGALIPAIASLVMGYISLSVLGATCKLCVGIYVASALTLIGAGGLWLRNWMGRTPSSFGGDAASPGPGEDPAWAGGGGGSVESAEPMGGPGSSGGAAGGRPGGAGGPVSFAKLAGFFGLGVLFVAGPVAAYVASAPDHGQFIGTCGQLDESPPEKLLVEMDETSGGVPAVEVFDPLCPACRQFEQHFQRTSYSKKLSRKAILFPLDSECNWMLDESVHPGACAVSEAVLCARGNNPRRVIDWAFEHQERIRRAAKSDSEAARRMLKDQFPGLASCVGSPKVKTELNQSLRWAVENELRILTPQLYVDGVRLCSEDVDIGLEFALSEMLKMRRNGTLHSRAGGDSRGDESDTEESP